MGYSMVTGGGGGIVGLEKKEMWGYCRVREGGGGGIVGSEKEMVGVL